MWADKYIERLKLGETVQFRPRGNSMSPRIKSGQLVTVEPIWANQKIKVGDVVLCKVSGNQYVHLVKSVELRCDGRYQIGNNHGKINGWTTFDKIYGIVTRVDD